MIEVMMAASVVGGLSLTVAQLMKNTSESTKQNEAKQENVSLKGLIQNNLSVPQACKNTFGALVTQANLTAMAGTGTVAVPNIRNKVGTGTILYSSTTNLLPLTITTMVLTNYVAGAGTADLVVNSTFKKSPSQIVMVKPIKIPINLNIDNTNPALPTLVNCSSMAVSGGEWMLGGNAGTVDGTDYLGTSDNQPLNFRVNNQKAGRIDSTGRLLAIGYQAANSANTTYTSGATALGHKALFSSVNNDFNTAVGYEALYTSTTGQSNTAVGAYALWSNNRSGSTAIGINALRSNTTGYSNIAIGTSTLYNNILGSANTVVGTVSLTSNTGSNNVALGYGIGSYNTSGSFNTYIGTSAGFNHKFGSNNIFLGNTAGTGVVNASNKLYIETTGNTTPLIGGDFSSRQVHLNGNVGIGTTTPGTPSTPIIATAGVTRLHVTGGKTILDQEAWQTPATQGSWVQTGGETIGYYMDSTGRVWLRGIMNGGTCSGNMLLLPAGYRPKVRVILSVGTNWGTPARLIIQTSGYVWCWVTPNPSAEIELNSLNFATH